MVSSHLFSILWSGFGPNGIFPVLSVQGMNTCPKGEMCSSYMKAGYLLPVQWLRHRKLPRNGVNYEDSSWGLVCTGAGDAVSERPILVVIRPDLGM